MWAAFCCQVGISKCLVCLHFLPMGGVNVRHSPLLCFSSNPGIPNQSVLLSPSRVLWLLVVLFPAYSCAQQGRARRSRSIPDILVWTGSPTPFNFDSDLFLIAVQELHIMLNLKYLNVLFIFFSYINCKAVLQPNDNILFLQR